MRKNYDYNSKIDKEYINQLSKKITWGDEDSGRQLYEIMKYPLMKHIKSYIIPLEDIEDILQDVFLIYLKKLKKEIKYDNCFGLLYKITDRLIYKYHKRIKKENMELEIQSENIDGGAEFDLNISYILLKLTERQKEILKLRAQSYTEMEIAKKMNISCSTVRRELYEIKKFKVLFM